MTHGISDELMSRFSEFVTARFALHFPRKRWRDLQRGLACAAREFGLKDSSECIRWLTTTQLSRCQLDTLAGCLTIGETYFFREWNSFEALETDILPTLINARRGRDQRLRIWSAGCSSGEEPYSIAMLLHRMIADLSQWNISILATDINPGSLRKAGQGEYGDWSFRGVPAWVKKNYFTKTGEGKFEISGTIKKMVTFAPLNLAEDPYPSLHNNTNALDIIFCRNVLMYFAPRQIKMVVGNFHRSLVADGWLIVSPCETSHTLFTGFETVSFPNAILYRKDDIDKTKTPIVEAAGGESIIAQPSIVSDPGGAPRFIPLPEPVRTPPMPVPERLDEESADSSYEEAKALYQNGLFAEAMMKLDESLSGGPGASAADILYGKSAALLSRIHANQGNFAAALEWAEKAIGADKLDPEAHYLQALIFQEQGADDAAIAALKRTLYIDQEFLLAHFTLANLMLRRGMMKDAARHLKNADSLLQAYGADDILPGSEGMSARRLAEIVLSTRREADR